jgi:hypothetical protein
MPTVKPRIAVTLTQEAYDALKGFSKASGRSMGSLVAEVIEQNIPIYRILEQMHSTAGKINHLASDEWAARLEALEMHAKDALGEIVLDASIELDKFSAAASVIGRGKAPRASNTGAKLTNQGEMPKKKSVSIH